MMEEIRVLAAMHGGYVLAAPFEEVDRIIFSTGPRQNDEGRRRSSQWRSVLRR